MVCRLHSANYYTCYKNVATVQILSWRSRSLAKVIKISLTYMTCKTRNSEPPQEQLSLLGVNVLSDVYAKVFILKSFKIPFLLHLFSPFFFFFFSNLGLQNSLAY